MSGPLYNTARWRAIRARRLAQDPLCVRCKEMGITAGANVVDHIIPHKNSRRLFFDFENTQSLCFPCHDKAKQSEERIGFDKRVGADGMPADPRHPFNRGRK